MENHSHFLKFVNDNTKDENLITFIILFNKYLTNNSKFVIDLYSIYSYIGFKNKFETLVKFEEFKYEIGKDYNITSSMKGLSIKLTIPCFKNFCYRINTTKSYNIWYNFTQMEELWAYYTRENEKNSLRNKRPVSW